MKALFCDAEDREEEKESTITEMQKGLCQQ